MTDAEIIKALEEKIKFQEFDESEYAVIKFETLKDVLDLIKRQKAEIERLQSILLCFMDEVTKWENKYCLDVSELPLIPIKGETKKIKNRIKAEAMTEFADKLQGRCLEQGGCIYASDIGAVLNEMEGDME